MKIQVKERDLTSVRQETPLPIVRARSEVPAKDRCCFFCCQEDAVIGGMCQWHYKYENYESK